MPHRGAIVAYLRKVPAPPVAEVPTTGEIADAVRVVIEDRVPGLVREAVAAELARWVLAPVELAPAELEETAA